MKALLLLAATGCMLAGCVSTETERVSSTVNDTPVYGLDDQPQTSVVGDGSLMPGAYGSRAAETGQFTGRERTNDQIGQRPTLPREADARELERDNETGKGAGTLGHSGIVPGEPVTGRTLLEEPETPERTPD
jgi:hypothetical protein